jgi:hypothetical protein
MIFSERSVLTLTLVVGVGLLLPETLGLGPAVRLVPLAVLIPTFALLVFQALVDLVPALESALGRLEADLLPRPPDVRANPPPREDQDASPAAEAASARRREAWVLGWLALLVGLIHLLGFAIALPLHTWLYLRWRAGEGWGFATTVAASLGAALYAAAGQVGGASFHTGRLWTWLGL